MIPVSQPFLAAIKAAPDDDAPRLVYADWLDEQAGGYDPRGEFIRDYIALARGDESKSRPIAIALEANAEVWTSNLPGEFVDLLGPTVRRGLPSDATAIFEFRRGFVEAATINAADWLAHGDAITAEHPVREVRLTTFQWPVGMYPGNTAWGDWKQLADNVRTSSRWPGITFHLPREDAP